MLLYKFIPVRFWHFHGQYLNIIITKRHIQIISTLVLVLFYGYLAQFNPPALRAILMLLLPLMLWLFNKKMRLILIWAYSLIALIMLMPAQVLSIGFWLSVMSVSGLLTFFSIRIIPATKSIRNPEINQVTSSYKNKIVQFIIQLIKTQWVILLVMTPLICYMGANLHGFSFVINLVLVPIITLILVPLGLLLLFVDVVLLHWIINHLCDYILLFLTQFKDSSAIGFNINLVQLICLELAVFIFLGAVPNKWFYISGLILLSFMNSQNNLKAGEFKSTILDVGQGQAVIIQTKNHQWIIDVGPGLNDQINSVTRTLIPYLKQYPSNNRTLVLSHDDSDHVFAFEQLLSTFNINQLYSGQPKRITQYSTNCREPQNLLLDSVEFRWLDMSAFKANNDNDFSCVLLVKSQYGSILISGDLSKKGEYYLSQQLKDLEVSALIIGHHGSNTSTSEKWLNFSHTNLAIVSRALDNQFGHPHINVSNRLKRLNIKLLDTALGGQIRLIFSKNGLKIENDSNRLSFSQ
ncbi:MAG: DNA internalization-related competence protein ComEC/Rec2 [Saccharospirillaceae bacterium]|nr:DNA internalization-related competence protein ComEC/Rec2 [Saccharospirillaceae bacterium]